MMSMARKYTFYGLTRPPGWMRTKRSPPAKSWTQSSRMNVNHLFSVWVAALFLSSPFAAAQVPEAGEWWPSEWGADDQRGAVFVVGGDGVGDLLVDAGEGGAILGAGIAPLEGLEDAPADLAGQVRVGVRQQYSELVPSKAGHPLGVAERLFIHLPGILARRREELLAAATASRRRR